MIWLTHLIFGILIYFITYKFFLNNAYLSILFGISVLLASILPDIDNKKSLIGRNFKLIQFFFGHRKFFHSPIIPIIFLITYLVINQPIRLLFLGLFLGYVGHLLLDSLSISGIELFGIKFKGFIKTGSFFEIVLILIFISLILILIFTFL